MTILVRSRVGLAVGAILAGLLVPTIVGVSPVQAAVQTYAYTGGPQIYVVPPGVTSIAVVLEGAQGASPSGGGAGGLGGRVSGSMSVVPGEVLQIMVGGSGDVGGYNGGGNGGGGTDIRRPAFSTSSSCAYNLTCGYAERVMVAGGGGAGGWHSPSGGGNGGIGGLAATAGTSNDDSSTPGQAGGAVSGGSGGSGGGAGGGTGAGANGGAGGGGALGWKPGANGGGGGGGFRGGGGGGAYTYQSAGGGGGGSSWVDGGQTSNVTYADGVRSGSGRVTIDPPSAITNAAFGFKGTGVDDTYTVPASVTSLAIRLYGAKGAADGDVVYGRLPVTPSQVLQITIGGAAPPVAEAVGGGSTTGGQGGYNGGGAAQSTGLGDLGTTGGGGGSDIRVAPYGLDQRIVVAGGGGGCGTPYWCPSNGWSPGEGGDGPSGVGGTGFWSAGGTKFAGGSLSGGGTWLDDTGNPISTPPAALGAWAVGGSGRSGAGGGYYGGAGGDASGGGSSFASISGPDLTRSGVGNVLGQAGAAFQHLRGGNSGDGMAVITAMPQGTTNPASSIRTTRANISGTVNPQYLASTPTVYYSSVDETTVTNGGGSSQSITSNGVSVLAGNTTQSVAGFITGLSAGTTYWYRVCAQSVAGNGCGATLSFTTLPVGYPDFTASTPTSPTAVLAPYSYTFTATGNTPRTMSVLSGNVPPGLTFTPGTGALAGTPTTPGTYTFVMRVSNSLGDADDTCVITVTGIAPVILDDTPGATGTVGTVYAPYTFTASGNEAPTFAVQSGSLPAGLSLNPNSGILSGTPTAAGVSTFVVRATNSAGHSDSPTLTITVSAAPNPNPPTPAPPSAPQSVSAVGGSGQVTVSWSAPASSGSYAISNYQVTASPGGASCSVAPPGTSCTVTGLSNVTAYTFTVAALSGAGWGPGASVGPITPGAAPLTPPAPVATSGNGQVSVTALGAATGPAPTSLTVTASPGGQSCTITGASGTCDVTGLTNGTTYTFTTVATNASGSSSSSVASAPAVPGAPITPAPQPLPAPLTPGSSALIVNGVPDPTVTVAPKPNDRGIVVTAPDFAMNLVGLDGHGHPLELGEGGVLILNADRQVLTSGNGFLPDTPVDLYVDPPVETPVAAVVSRARSPRTSAIYIGSVTTNAQGEFEGTGTLPASITAGDHTLQAVGVTRGNQSRAMSLGVRVNAETPSITLVKGSRTADGRHDRIKARGTTLAIAAGEHLTPWVKFAGGEFTQGSATIVVQADGTFRWTRQVRKDKRLSAFVSWQSTDSNTVSWARIR